MKIIHTAIMFTVMMLMMPSSNATAANAPILFSKEEVVIRRAQPVPEPVMPWQTPGEQQMRPDIRLDTEIRDAATLVSQNGWFNLSSPADHQAVMLMMPKEEIATIPPSSQYAPLDILLIDKEGVIREIYPQLKLAELAEPITSQSAVLALLFLRGGVHESWVIKPGDSIIYKAFKKPPASLSIPTENTNQTRP